MEIREEKREGNLVVLSVEGRIDPTTVGAVEQRLLKSMADGDKRLVLDLAKMEYISSAGLRVLLMTAKKLKGAGGSIVLCTVPRQVKEVLDISGFSSIFTITATIEEALTALRR